MTDRDILYADLSRKIIGALFDVFNSLGYSYREAYYQKAIALSLKDLGIEFKEQIRTPLRFKNIIIGHGICDFLIEDKIVVEVKRGDHFSRHDIQQLFTYLKSMGLQLGLLARFSKDGVKIKRIVNII